MNITNQYIINWVQDIARITLPDSIYWVDGSEEERQRLISRGVEEASFFPINSKSWNNCYRYIDDSINKEEIKNNSYYCSDSAEQALPNFKWMQSKKMHSQIENIIFGSMKGKTMFVVPCILGPENTQFLRTGVQITDSIYVVLNLLMLSRAGDTAWKQISDSNNFYKGLHVTQTEPLHKPIYAVFPEEKSIYCVNTTNITQAVMNTVPWGITLSNLEDNIEDYKNSNNLLAAHMMILGVKTPENKTYYIAAASPSSGGKSELAKTKVPEIPEYEGYETFTVCDDIAWLHTSPDGRLWAINPQTGFSYALKDINENHSPELFSEIKSNALYSNIAKDQFDQPWWYGKNSETPKMLKDWKDQIVLIDKDTNLKKLSPNARVTIEANLNNSLVFTSGVPLSAILFLTKSRNNVPIISEARSWAEGVFYGASLNRESEFGREFNPMGVYPFLAEKLEHHLDTWLDYEDKLENLPKTYLVNWYRINENSNYIWPGGSDNFRIIEWIIKRIENKVEAEENFFGLAPLNTDINLKDCVISTQVFKELLQEIDLELAEDRFEKSVEFLEEQGNIPERISATIDKLRLYFE